MSTLKAKNTPADYLIASGNVKPWLVALSAVATNNSGYMFIGMIGYKY
jgi:sodium/proline symporter